MTTLEIILIIILFLGLFELYSLITKLKEDVSELKDEIEELKDKDSPFTNSDDEGRG